MGSVLMHHTENIKPEPACGVGGVMLCWASCILMGRWELLVAAGWICELQSWWGPWCWLSQGHAKGLVRWNHALDVIDEPGSYIAHYFHFSITFSTLLIHYYAPCQHDLLHEPLWLFAFTSLDQPCLFDGHMMYDSHVYSSPFSYFMYPPVARPITNHHATQSGTYYSFTFDEPCACFLVYHLYLTCLYLPFSQRVFPIWVSPSFQI